METKAEGFDIIGDIHGQADHLAGLLDAMGYRKKRTSFTHPTRRALFVGDLIDRGPKQYETVRIVSAMVESGNAQMVLGNHEINAIRYRLREPKSSDGFARPHTKKARSIHSAFLDQLVEGSDDYNKVVDWFSELPVWLDLDGLRVVHACWHVPSVDLMRPLMGTAGSITEELLRSAPGSGPEVALATLTRGPEVEVAQPYLFRSGTRTGKARYRWWDPEATTLDRALLLPDDARSVDGTPYPPLPADPLVAPIEPYEEDVPVFVGHYWLKGEPEILSSQIACLDFSVARGGPLVAYRWQGESTLSNDNFASFNLDQ